MQTDRPWGNQDTAAPTRSADADVPGDEVARLKLRVSELEAQKRTLEGMVDQRWIPVSERLPEEGVDVFVATTVDVGVAHRTSGGGWLRGGDRQLIFYKVTAWQPLPDPPEAE